MNDIQSLFLPHLFDEFLIILNNSFNLMMVRLLQSYHHFFKYSHHSTITLTLSRFSIRAYGEFTSPLRSVDTFKTGK